MGEKYKELNGRLLSFTVDIVNYWRALENNEETRIFKNQLIKSSTSSGANYEEAQGASSKQDFLNKIRISLKEMRESCYWLKIMRSLKYPQPDKLNRLYSEPEELKCILGSISSRVGIELEKRK